MSVNLKSLIGKLNSTTKSAVEGAAKLAMSRTNHYIEVEHFLRLLLDSTDNDFFSIANHYGVNADRLTQEVDVSIDKLKRGNARTPGIGDSVLKMMTEAWTIGSIEFNSGQIRTGFAVMALLSNEDLSRQVKEFSKELAKINVEGLKKEFMLITQNSSEETAPLSGGTAGPGQSAAAGARPGSGDRKSVV